MGKNSSAVLMKWKRSRIFFFSSVGSFGLLKASLWNWFMSIQRWNQHVCSIKGPLKSPSKGSFPYKLDCAPLVLFISLETYLRFVIRGGVRFIFWHVVCVLFWQLMRCDCVKTQEADNLDSAPFSPSSPREKWLRRRTHVKLRVNKQCFVDCKSADTSVMLRRLN